ncbi:tRNA pseudouridine(65) synthase TruC [Arsukibacterium sp.]|uniref:tRNA pseudouridine(65) synthase TruC n=1 Tax=Arsukibacterium sp. TaxID=1977258 RepID=UPI002FD8BB7B
MAEPELSCAPILPILYQDHALVVIDKPAGMLVHRSFLDKHETLFVMQTLRDQLGQHVYPVHRLDRPTSGVLVFALSSEVARLLSEQNQAGLWQKGYLALVRGFINEAGELDYPLSRQLDDIADKFSHDDKAAQQALTRYQPLQQVELPFAVGRYASSRYALVALQPLTGRKHQLRRHLAHLRHPIIGDTSHGDGKHNAFFKQQLHCPRLMLMAYTLRLKHPLTAEPLHFTAHLTDFVPLLQRFDWPTDAGYYQQCFSEFLVEKT